MSRILPPAETSAGVLLPDTSENEFGKLGWLNWWYALSLPPKPTEGASFKLQDTYRRARLASILLLLLLIMMVATNLISIFTHNVATVGVTVVVSILLVIAVLLNRSGRLVIEGLLIVGLWTAAMVLLFLAQPSLTIDGLIQYDLLVVAILLAVTFFPPWSVFLVALFNCVFVMVSLHNLKYDSAVAQLMMHEGMSKVATRPISLTVVIMVITYLWARSSQHALERADRAEMIARLQYDLADRDQKIATQKAQLDHSIQQIVKVLVEYSNGNVTSRVPLTQDNVLWNIAGPINNLLGRVQRMRHAEAELARVHAALQQARQENAMLRATMPRQQ